MQEEHADLLALIAQQELELSVFRTKMVDLVGVDTTHHVEEEARLKVEERYGSYTDYRSVEVA